MEHDPALEYLKGAVAANKELMLSMFTERDRAMAIALVERDKAIAVAAFAMDKRMDSINEFRLQLSDQAARFITRPEHDTLVAQITQTQLLQQAFSGNYITRQELNVANDAIDKLRDSNSAAQGKSSVVSQLVSFGIAGVAVLVSIASFTYSNHTATTTSLNPTVGADTKRVDDLILQNNEQNRQMGQRLDALSARLNGLTKQPTAP